MDRYIRIKVNDNGDVLAGINGLTAAQVGLCVGSVLYQIQDQMPLGPYDKDMVFRLFTEAMSKGYDAAAKSAGIEECQA